MENNQNRSMSKLSKCLALAREIRDKDEYIMMEPFRDDNIQDQYRKLVQMLLDVDIPELKQYNN